MHNFTKCVMDTLTRKTGVRCSSEQVMGVVKLLGPRLKAELGLRFNPEECEYLSFGSWTNLLQCASGTIKCFFNENICVLNRGLDSLVYTASRIQVIICSRWVIRSIRSWNVDTLFNWIKKSDMFFFLQVPSTLLKVRQVCIRNYHTCKTCSQFKSVLKKILLSTPNIHSFGIIHSLCVNRESRGLVVN